MRINQVSLKGLVGKLQSAQVVKAFDFDSIGLGLDWIGLELSGLNAVVLLF